MYSSHRRSLGMTTAKSLGKGILMGLVFFLPGVMVIIHWENINRFFNEIDELPVLTSVSRDFKSGFEVAGFLFRDQSIKFYEVDSNVVILENEEWVSQTVEKPFSQKLSPKVDATLTEWDREKIEQKLAGEFSKKRMQMVRKYLDYVEKYRNLAAKSMTITRIPASISLAQGLLESDAGRSFLARKANNHFGIKCVPLKAEKGKGRKYRRHSLAFDCLQRKDDYAWDRFEMYNSAEISYERHARLLAQSERYNWMLNRYFTGEMYKVPGEWFGVEEVPYYAAWAIGLKKSGYATNKHYAQKVALIVETYELWRIDYGIIFKGYVPNQKEMIAD